MSMTMSCSVCQYSLSCIANSSFWLRHCFFIPVQCFTCFAWYLLNVSCNIHFCAFPGCLGAAHTKYHFCYLCGICMMFSQCLCGVCIITLQQLHIALGMFACLLYSCGAGAVFVPWYMLCVFAYKECVVSKRQREQISKQGWLQAKDGQALHN